MGMQFKETSHFNAIYITRRHHVDIEVINNLRSKDDDDVFHCTGHRRRVLSLVASFVAQSAQFVS